jgi:hypothetical protein
MSLWRRYAVHGGILPGSPTLLTSQTGVLLATASTQRGGGAHREDA